MDSSSIIESMMKEKKDRTYTFIDITRTFFALFESRTMQQIEKRDRTKCN